MYTIDYQNGIQDEGYKTVENAMATAEALLSYTQQSVTIINEDNTVITRLPWWGTEPSEDDTVTKQFGDYGFYSEWEPID